MVSRRPTNDKLKLAPSLLVGGALYFLFHWSPKVLRYDLATREMTLMDLPPTTEMGMGNYFLRISEDGGLGVTAVEDTIAKQWSKRAGPGEDNGWTQSKVVELKKLLPAHASAFVDVVGCVEGSGVLFMRKPGGLFSVDPKSGCAMAVELEGNPSFFNIIPYMSFNMPGTTTLFSLRLPVFRITNISVTCEFG